MGCENVVFSDWVLFFLSYEVVFCLKGLGVRNGVEISSMRRMEI